MNPEDVMAKLSEPLSMRRRIANMIALLGGLAGSAVVGLLWATEPGLPLRTQVAFGALVLIGLAWAGYGGWALTRRTPLFALDRVIAAWLAMGATSLLAVTVFGITALRHRLEPAIFGTAVVLLTVAFVNLARARGHRAALLRRKRELGG